jgi:predicted  nucleic acid-binding Zn-ribbon protein
MTDIAREKFVRAMAEVDKLEDRVEELENAVCSSDEEERQRALELAEAREQLAEKMWQLAKITDACRKIHVRR